MLVGCWCLVLRVLLQDTLGGDACRVLLVGVWSCCKTRQVVMLFFEMFGARRTHCIILALIHKFATHPPNMQ